MRKSLYFFAYLLISINFLGASGPTDEDISEKLLNGGVVVRVWKPLTGGDLVGHASLQTKTDYISFWPDHDKGGKFNTLEEDYSAEKRPADISIFLKNPNPAATEKLRTEFNFLKELLSNKELSWSLSSGQGQEFKDEFSRDSFNNSVALSKLLKDEGYKDKLQERWEFNCCGIVYNLLKVNKFFTEKEPFIGKPVNTFLTPMQLANSCSPTSQRLFLKQFFLKKNIPQNISLHDFWNYRVISKHKMQGLLSFAEVKFGYHMIKDHMDKKITWNTKFEEETVEMIKSEGSEDILVTLAKMGFETNLSQLILPFLQDGSKK